MKAFVSFCLLTTLTLIAPISRAQTPKKDILSTFSFLDTDGNKFTNKDIPHNSPLLLIYFRTDCPECRYEAKHLTATAKNYPVMIWMVSPNKMETLGAFEYMMGLYKIQNIEVLQDYRDLMHQTFSFKLLPFCVLFNSQGQVIKTYSDLPTASTVKEDLSK